MERKIKHWCAIVALVIVTISLGSCATSYDKRGRVHEVRRGETIWSVARAYRVAVQELAEYNNIEDPGDVHAGLLLHIPGSAEQPEFKHLLIEKGGVAPAPRLSRGRHHYHKESIEVEHGRFRWPVQGVLLSPFGMRNGRRHDGIDIKAQSGTPIKAAAAGNVAFSGRMRGYGNLILLKHDGGFFTAYAHNSRNKVKKGALVKQGQVIALVGRTGRATGPHLHFEVRHGQTARNPLFFLPKRKG